MCGIFALVNRRRTENTEFLVKGTEIINHRGPDDEGYLVWDGLTLRAFAGENTSINSKETKKLDKLPSQIAWRVGLGHKRLSIIDLSAAGHQPMLHKETGISLTYNGEIYNYQELRDQLKSKGYKFQSESDTEVLLLAWVEWGVDCLAKLNGMFAFVVLDPRNGGKLYAARDPFGIKPLYFATFPDYIAFASEIKQIRLLPQFSSSLNDQVILDYLVHGFLDHTSQTFDKSITQLRGGELALVDLSQSQPSVEVTTWYKPNIKPWKGSEEQAIQRFYELFEDSIKLQLRSDVPLGSCLSGGLDSSAIVCMVHQAISGGANRYAQVTVTACYEDPRFDEWNFAKTVVDKTSAQYNKVFPTFEKLQNDLDKLIWHMDEPFGSTSQFSQWSVFEKAAQVGLKVMLDGQGADEQLAGYSGNDTPLYAGLMSKFSVLDLYKEVLSYKKINKLLPKSQLIKGLEAAFPSLARFFPDSLKKKMVTGIPHWANGDIQMRKKNIPSSLRNAMIDQIFCSSLPALLRYEDRNSMAFSIESRVPFLDTRLVEFVLGLPEKLIYKEGLRKVILRKAMKKVLPEEISNRRDKMGFVTPEEVWLRIQGPDWFKEKIMDSVGLLPQYFHRDEVEKYMNKVIKAEVKFDFTLWRIMCLGVWHNMIERELRM